MSHRRFPIVQLCALLLSFPLMVQAERATPLAYLDQLPPLLDRELFFGDPDISAAQLSPDGRYLSFIRPHQGVRNIWVKGIDESFDQARPITADDKPVPGYFWSRDGRFVLYVQDRGGDENFHVWAVDPAAAPEAEGGVPPARNITDFDGVRAFILGLPRNHPDRILVGLNDRDPALHDVYAVSIATGERELLIENSQNVLGWVPDPEGIVRLALRQTGDGGTEVLRVEDGRLGEPIYTCSWLESCSPLAFQPGGEKLWLISNRGDVDLIGLYQMDLASGETTLFERDPEGEVDFAGAVFHPETDALLATVYIGDRPRIVAHDETFAADLAFLRAELPEGEISFPSRTLDGRLSLVSLARDVDPGTVYLFDHDARTVTELYRSRPELPIEHMAEMQPIRYTARDGLEIPGYLSLPKGVPAENLAVVALIHGGPWARDTWGFRSEVQFLTNRGYAVFQPNFRASTGFGKAFLNAGNLQWGDAMQDDITDGIQYLIEQGIADPERVCIMGGSYGGYATLAGMVFTPELYACGVNIVGVSNLITLINSIPAYWGPARMQFTLRMGDPDTAEGRAQLKRQSPIHHVDNIQRPLLVIHGANDPRVRQAEADQIVVAMREAGLPVEYIVAPDEGHGFRGRDNRLAMYARTEQFLAAHLGGRYQADMPAAIAERLAAITVDIDSVEVVDLADELAAARTRPLPTVDAGSVARGRLDYRTQLDFGGSELVIETVRRIHQEDEDGRELLVIESTSSTPMGEISDRFVLDGLSLRPIQRITRQGPSVADVSFSSREISGQIEAMGQQIPVQLALEAPVFGADSALDIVLSALPLVEGFRSPIRIADLSGQARVRFFQLEVGAVETLSIAAGEFQTWPLKLTPLDGIGSEMQYWVSADSPRRLLRTEGQTPPEMGAMAFVTELTGFEAD